MTDEWIARLRHDENKIHSNVNHLARIRRCTSDCDSASSYGQTVDVEVYDQAL